MAKRNYTSRIEQSVMQFGNDEKKEETIKTTAEETKLSSDNEINKESDKKISHEENVSEKHNDVSAAEEAAPTEETHEIPADFLKRGTYFLTYAETEAINTISYRKMAGKSYVLREILAKGLEEMYPGILDEVSERAEKRKKKDFDALTEVERKKLIKKAEKD